jgi:hypothetical protein
MHVRFRRQGRRLNVSLIENRRPATDKAKVVAEHIGALGSVDAAISVRERLAFWAKLHQRLDKLGNRVGADQHAKIYAAVAARIPMVTPDEQRALQEEYFTREAQISETIRDMAEGMVAGHKSLIADAEKALADHAPAAERFAADAAAAKDKLAKLKRGDSVPGGLGKQPAVEKVFREAGWTRRDINDARLRAEVVEVLGEGVIGQMVDLQLKAMERAERRILRRMALIAAKRLASDRLDALRLPGESDSDVILRLVQIEARQGVSPSA